jgi:hypothetical protein
MILNAKRNKLGATTKCVIPDGNDGTIPFADDHVSGANLVLEIVRDIGARVFVWGHLFQEAAKAVENAWESREPVTTHGIVSPFRIRFRAKDVNKKLRREIVDEFKLLHKTAPKYTFQKEQRHDVSAEYGIEVVTLKATYGPSSGRRRTIIIDGGGACSVEEYACGHFRSLGYSTLIVGNAPIWVLFGVYMSPLIQDAEDPYNRRVGVGFKFDAEGRTELVWTLLPEDFGKPGYWIRRGEAIKKHLSLITSEPEGLQQLFDRWLGPSEDLRADPRSSDSG